MSLISRILGRRDQPLQVANTRFESLSVRAAHEEIAALRSQVQSNRYEAAQPNSPDRAWVPGFTRDARFDANSFSRWEMFRKISYYRRNVWLLQRLQDEFTKWTVGPNGLTIIPASSDQEWNRRMSDAYQEWSESPFLDSTLTMSQGWKQLAGEFHLFGGLFINYTRIKEAGKQAVPAIQFIESHRVSSPGQEFTLRDAVDIIDGVQLGMADESGRAVKPVGYHVKDTTDASKWDFRSTRNMLHVYDPERVGMFREITPYHTVLLTIGDILELETMEMSRAKQNAENAFLVQTPSGELPASLQGTLQSRYGGPQKAVGPSEQDILKRVQQYRRVLGSKVIAGRTDEVWKEWTNNNPSAATQWYWRYKIGQICSASGMPMLLIFPELIESSQGTVVRGVYDNAHEFFRSKFFVFSHAGRRTYRFFADWARYNIKGLEDAPADWMHCHVIPPRAVNVDVGYNSSATLAELAAGVTNWDDIAGRYNTTAEILLRKKTRNVTMLKRICEEESKASGYDVSPEEVSQPLAEVLQVLTASQEPEAETEAEEPEGEPVKIKKQKKSEEVEV